MSKRKKTSRKTSKQTPATLREKTKKNLKILEKQEASTKQKKKQLLLVLIGAGVVVVLGLVLSGILIFKAVEKPIIGFKDVPSSVKEAIISLAKEETQKSGTQWKYITIDPAAPIKEQKNLFYKTDLLITSSGASAAQLGEYAAPPPQSILALMPTAIRGAGFDGAKQYALPILLDHFELAWNIKLLRKAGLTPPTTLEQLISVSKKVKSNSVFPLICAGKDDETLLSFVGTLVESFHEEAGWKTVLLSAKSMTPADLLSQPNLSDVLQTLINWRKEGFLHPEWFRMTQDDVVAFMENDYAVFVAMSLLDHRQVPQNVIEKFNSTYFPGLSEGSSRSFTAPAILALTPEKNKIHPAALLFRNSLLRPEIQSKLSSKSGLAPTSSQAETPDKQANDVRFWVAASSNPLSSFYTALYADQEKTKELASKIREYLESEGMGR